MPLLPLSICIPTYNFGPFIGETLKSIVSQLTDDVEVVVLDGASTDNTPNIVRQFQENCPNLMYHRLDKKSGIDRDMAKSVEVANGEYCWLFSSDDIMHQGAIKKVLGYIEDGQPDVCLCKHMNCTSDMKLMSEHPVLRSNKKCEFQLANPSERRRYFRLAQNTEAFFSFMGGIIIRKSKWDSVPMNEEFAGSCWGHVARIFAVMPMGLSVKYFAEPLLNRRGGVDSFSKNGIVDRYRIGIEGYHKLGDVFFGHESFEAYHLRRAIRNEFNLRSFLRARLLCWKDPSRENIDTLEMLFRKTYKDTPLLFILNYFIYKSVFTWLRHVLEYAYRLKDEIKNKTGIT